MNAENDRELLNFGIGFTNIVERTTRANQELSRQEIEEGKNTYSTTSKKWGRQVMKNLIWNVIVEWDAVWQQSAKSLLKTIELLRLSLSWPDLCQLVASDKQTCPAGDLPKLLRWHPPREFWPWLTIPFIKFKSCSTTVASFRSPLLSADKWQSTAVDTQCSVLSLSLIHIWRCRRYSLCRSRWSPYH